MTNLSKLRDDHLWLLATARRLGALIDQPKPPPRLHLFTLRHELSSVLIAHLKSEDWSLYPTLLASTDAHITATAREFSAEMGGLALDYRAHCEKWNATAIAGDWPGYRRDCREILDAVILRITREDRELYPLLQTTARAA